jgi:hypothetical protein
MSKRTATEIVADIQNNAGNYCDDKITWEAFNARAIALWDEAAKSARVLLAVTAEIRRGLPAC